MTLHELEDTLRTLESRHPGLNEVMLVTLLRAGGWEEKEIEEARALFRAGAPQPPREEKKEAPSIPLPHHDAVSFPLPLDEEHLLLQKNQLHSERESLMKEETKAVSRAKDEPPHNLPLRPFETSEHVWPFSRYKSVFFGDDDPIQQKPLQTKPTQGVFASNRSIPEEKVQERNVRVTAPIHETVETTHAGGDEKLIYVACIMLVIIILLLGYMYSNGRL